MKPSNLIVRDNLWAQDANHVQLACSVLYTGLPDVLCVAQGRLHLEKGHHHVIDVQAAPSTLMDLMVQEALSINMMEMRTVRHAPQARHRTKHVHSVRCVVLELKLLLVAGTCVCLVTVVVVVVVVVVVMVGKMSYA